jgi:hypothetical protein
VIPNFLLGILLGLGAQARKIGEEQRLQVPLAIGPILDGPRGR